MEITRLRVNGDSRRRYHTKGDYQLREREGWLGKEIAPSQGRREGLLAHPGN